MPGNRRMEKGMKEIHKFLAEHATEDMSMDEINALLNEHLKEMNSGVAEPVTEETAETADDLMDLAEDALEDGNEQEALRLARKALKLEAAGKCGVDKAITFEFSHFMSPNSMYTSAHGLYDRYMEYRQQLMARGGGL